jgi:hypothetical protein
LGKRENGNCSCEEEGDERFLINPEDAADWAYLVSIRGKQLECFVEVDF